MKEFTLRKNQNLGNVNIGKQYMVKFDIFFEKMGEFSGTPSWKSLLHLTASGNNAEAVGDRIPSVFLNNEKKLHIGVDLNGKVNHLFESKQLEEKRWYTLELSQKLMEDGTVDSQIKLKCGDTKEKHHLEIDKTALAKIKL